MLLGNASKKPNLEHVRGMKAALRHVLGLAEDATLTISQLACFETGCAPLETVFGLLRPGAPQQQHKIHKAADDVVASDLAEVCEAWGHTIDIEDLLTFFEEN